MKVISLLLLFVSLAWLPALSQSSRTPWRRDAGEVVRTLDSLAAISIGPYIHIVVGSCVGGRCEERISIYRDNEFESYRYNAGAWVDLPARPKFYVSNQQLPEERAGMILADARLAGIMALVGDSASTDRRRPRFWLRARFGARTLSIDAASLSGPNYTAAVAGGPGEIYSRVEKALLAPLHEQYRQRKEEE